MNNLKLFTILFLSMLLNLFSSPLKAEVWHSKNSWDLHWEKEYQEWIEKNLTKDIFTRDDGLLSGIATDCADALYDVRILFSYENSLPFIINAPDVLKNKMQLFGSNTSMFDTIKDEKKRVRAFINFINDEVGTENLTKDTFPIRVEEINAGVIYKVVWHLLGKEEHHSYILKGFGDDGELRYYASDAPKKVRKLQVDSPYPRFSFESAPYGFRRFKHPEHLLIPEKVIPREYGYGLNQYVLAKKYGKKQVLKEIRKILQK